MWVACAGQDGQAIPVKSSIVFHYVLCLLVNLARHYRLTLVQLLFNHEAHKSERQILDDEPDTYSEGLPKDLL